MTISNSNTREPSPLEFMFLAKRGNKPAWDIIYAYYFAPIFRYIFYKIRDKKVAGDLTAATFQEAYQHFDQLHVLTKPTISYLYQIAKRLVAEMGQKRRVKINGGFEDVYIEMGFNDEEGENGFDRDEYSRLRQILNYLSTEQRDAIILKYIVGMPYKEIAVEMQKSEENIYQLVCQSLLKIRKDFF